MKFYARVAVVAFALLLFLRSFVHLRERTAYLDADSETHETRGWLDWSEGGIQKAVSNVVKSRPLSQRSAFVIASQRKENTTWFHEYFSGWEKYIYVVDDSNATYTVDVNKGRETMVYLSFIIDNYNNLPDNILFLHSTRYQWHNDDPEYDGVSMLQSFQIPYLQKMGYVNLRCTWSLGCPVEIQPFAEADIPRDENYPHAGDSFGKAFTELFPGTPVPEVVGVSCCAQFAATKDRIRKRPKSDYIHYRDWLLDTELNDSISGRVFEYSWHMIFGEKPVYCPGAEECYCNVFGLCNLSCPDVGHCDGRYTLPPFSNLPIGWPEIGWNGEPRVQQELGDFTAATAARLG